MGPNAVASLSKWGCFVSGDSMMLPPGLGTLGTMGRDIFRNNGTAHSLAVSKASAKSPVPRASDGKPDLNGVRQGGGTGRG